MRKLIVGVLVVSALFFLGGCAASDEPPQKEEAVSKAQELFADLQNKGFNFDSGPCISNNLLDDEEALWVADVVHVPRADVDDLPENQCARYRSGDAKYFVELDLEGTVVRAQ